MDEVKIRHLEMIQGVITRMAQNSFALKGWAVTLVSALFALSVMGTNQAYCFLAYVPISVFWFLDSYYLQMERRFRVLYDEVAACETADKLFSMKPGSAAADKKTLYVQSLLSFTEAVFYLPLVLLTSAVTLVSIFVLS
jgi:hypothetical protein